MALGRDLAKAPSEAWRSAPPYPERPGFRHELASTIALLELVRRADPMHPALLGPQMPLLRALGEEPVVPDPIDADHPLARELCALSASELDLVAYLVCAHHGKVRCAWMSTAKDQDAGIGAIHGVCEGDEVPATAVRGADGTHELPALKLSLAPAGLGVGAQIRRVVGGARGGALGGARAVRAGVLGSGATRSRCARVQAARSVGSLAMTIHVNRLAGCSPTPLARYLKSLAVLRLVSEQKDATARGFFRDDVFHLVTELDEAALVRFFVDEYAPTPIVTPWNGGSGFYPKDSKTGIDAIEASTVPRLAPYRSTLAAVRSIVGARKEAPKNEAKLELLAECRAKLSGPSLEWMNAAVALAADANGRTGYPALLGTGGNDGRLDFANNFMQRVAAIVLGAGGGASTIRHALFGAPSRGLAGGAIGQFFPGGAGGVNATSGFEGSSLFDTWDFVLMLEGAIVLSVAAARRLDVGVAAQLSGPFTLRASAAGFGSAAGTETAARGEQWMPLWSKPANLAEVSALFAEGRMQCGRVPAKRAVDAARALARLGVARGIDAFERYGYLERNGRSNFAVPLGRWTVPTTAPKHIDLLDEIAPWVDALRRASGRDGAPASLGRDVLRLEHAMLDVCRGAHVAGRWERLLVALGDAEEGLLARRKATKELRLQPIPTLSPEWITAASGADGATELRIATAIASQVTPGKGDEARSLGPIRVHCVPLDRGKRTPRFATIGDGLAPDPRVVWRGRDLVSDLGAVVGRRLIEAGGAGLPGLALRGRVNAPADGVDAFVAAQTDDARIARLVRPLMAIDFARSEAVKAATGQWGYTRAASKPSPVYALFRVVYSTELPSGRDLKVVRCDPAPVRRLLAGDLTSAARGALARLQAMGARPKVRVLGGSSALARRVAASLAIPISATQVGRAFDAICKPSTEE